MFNRTIKELANKNGRVYVYLEDEETGNKFMTQAENEGFKFPDGVKPTERCYAEIMAVNRDTTINFVGMNGRIAFGSGAKTVGNEELIRVDYKKYIDGDRKYIHDGNN